MNSNRGIGKRTKERGNLGKRLGDKSDQNNSKRRASTLPYNKPRGNLVMAVKITGIVQTDEGECISLLKLKAPLPIVITKVGRVDQTYWHDGALYLVLKSPKEAAAVKNQNGLMITVEFYKPNSGAQEQSSEIITKLTNLVTSRYDTTAKYLNLNGLVEDPIFLSTNLKGFSHTTIGKKFGIALCKLISDQCPDIKTLSLENNRITDTHFFSTLSRRIPNLENISFKDNAIRSFEDLKPFNGSEFKNLRELILEGNPIRDKELSKAGGLINFRSNIKSLFPTLKLLDGEELLEEIEFGIEEAKKLPVTVKSGFSDTEVSLATAQNFLAQFFEHFDGNRNLLSNFYEHNSCFSLVVANNISNARMDKHTHDNLFKAWNNNRNLIRVKQADKRFSMLHVGAENIINAFNQLPKTKHPLEEPPEKKRFVFDSYQFGSGSNVYLYIYIHGEFSLPGNTNSKRSFDRTFIVIPPIPGSRAALAGLPVSIVNDSMVLRTYANNFAWSKAEDLNKPAPQEKIALSEVPNFQLLQALQVDQQLEMIVQFSKATGLNYGFSWQCLQENGWAEPAAMDSFQNCKPQLPPEAFQM